MLRSTIDAENVGESNLLTKVSARAIDTKRRNSRGQIRASQTHCMPNLLVRHMLSQGAVVGDEPDCRPLFRRELGKQVVEEIQLD